MGEINVDRMLSKITLEQLTDWLAYTSIVGPIDDRRGDSQVSFIRMDLYNIFRGNKSAKTNPEEFALKWITKERTNRGWQHNKQMAYLIAGATAGQK